MKENKKAVGCFIEYDNKILILHRNNNVPQKNKWGLTGGEIDLNSSPEETLIKKISDEIGCNFLKSNLNFLGKYNLNYTDENFEFYTYRIKVKKIIDIKLNTIGHDKYKWISPEECYLMPDLLDGLYVLLKDIYLKNK